MPLPRPFQRFRVAGGFRVDALGLSFRAGKQNNYEMKINDKSVNK
jgi:hypothetical protein